MMWVAGLGLMAAWFYFMLWLDSDEGWEDETGFHVGREKDK